MAHRTRRRRLASLATGVLLAGAGTIGLSAAVTPASAASCSPKTDYDVNATWSNWCGIGTHDFSQGPGQWHGVFEIRDATAPYHRVWLHNYYTWSPSAGGQWHTWSYCLYSRDKDVSPPASNHNFLYVQNVQISANTSPC
jgi:hypothetical protein